MKRQGSNKRAAVVVSKPTAGIGLANGVSRRRALAMLTVALPTLWTARLPHAAERGRRVVIAGGGFGGLSVATALRRLAPRAEIVVIDPHPAFFSAPSSLDVVFGRKSMAEASRSYAALAAPNVRVVRGHVKAVDVKRGRVETDAGSFDCTAFVLATGMELRPQAIRGLEANLAANLSFYDRNALPELARRIAAFKGGTVIVSVPPGAVKCPPAPYEYALALARHFEAKGIDGKVVLIDARPSPEPNAIGSAIGAALRAASGRIDYIEQEVVKEVDLKAREVVTGFGDRIRFDLLSLIPPNEATHLVAALELAAPGDRYAEVDPLTFRSARYENVFALGDVARTPYGNTAAGAIASATLCARAVGALLAGSPPANAPETAELAASCYPMIRAGGALRLEVAYAVRRKPVGFDLATQVVAEQEPSADNVERRERWQQSVLASLFKAEPHRGARAGTKRP